MGKRRDPGEGDDTVCLVSSHPKKAKRINTTQEARFIGKPIPVSEARQKWPKRYEQKVLFLPYSL